MKDNSKYNKCTTNTPSPNIIRFDQNSTDQLLKQLKISLKNVEAIIQKSKQSLGLKPVNHELRSPLPREGSSFNFNVSIDADQSRIKDELTYSLSPQTDSRFKNTQQTIKNAGNCTSKSLYNQILFQQSKQMQQMQHNLLLTPVTVQKSSVLVDEKKSKEISIKIETYERQVREEINKNQAPLRRRLNDLQIDICTSDEPDEEQQFRYQQEYCIVINKGNKRENKQVDEDLTLKKQDYIQYEKTKNSEQSQQNSIIYKKIELFSRQKNGINDKLQRQQLKEKQNSEKKEKISSLTWRDSMNPVQKSQRYEKSQEISGSNKNVNNHKNSTSKNSNKNEQIINQSQLVNTCTKNQLQNILILKSSSRKSKNQNNLQMLNKSAKVIHNSKQALRLSGKKSFQKKNKNKVSPISNKFAKPQSKQTIKSPTKSPQKSPVRPGYNSKRSDGMSPTVSKWKPNYIQKYINVLSQKKGKKQKASPNNQKNQQNKSPEKTKNILQRYSHPLKSPQKRKSAVLQIQYHTNQFTQQCNKQLFMSLMKQQCYVRRFLTEAELNYIFQQFFHKKIPRYLWEQKVIQKIFKKIHQSDEII